MTDYKIVLYGDYSVGKTSLINRLLKNSFKELSQATIGAAFIAWKTLLINPKTQKELLIGLWDTAGSERFESLIPMYLRNADIVLYCWDYNIPFDTARAISQYKIAKQYAPMCSYYLVFTKIDRTIENPVNIAADFMVDRNVAGVYYTSSLSGEGVTDLFTEVIKKLIENPAIVDKSTEKDVVKLENQKNTTRSYCC